MDSGPTQGWRPMRRRGAWAKWNELPDLIEQWQAAGIFCRLPAGIKTKPASLNSWTRSSSPFEQALSPLLIVAFPFTERALLSSCFMQTGLFAIG